MIFGLTGLTGMQDKDKMVIIFVRKQITKHVKASRLLDLTSIYPWELKEMTSDVRATYLKVEQSITS